MPGLLLPPPAAAAVWLAKLPPVSDQLPGSLLGLLLLLNAGELPAVIQKRHVCGIVSHSHNTS